MPDWKYVELGDLCDPARGITYGIVKVGDYVVGGVPVIRGGDIRNNRIVFNEEKRVSAEVSNQFKRTILRGGEIILNLIAEPGHAALVPASMAGYNVSRDVAVISLIDQVNGAFVSYFLRSPEAIGWLTARLQGSVTQKINLGTLRQVPVSVPPRTQQDAIAAVLGALDDKIAVNSKIAATGEALAVALSSGEQQATVPLKDIVDHVRDQVLPETLVAERVAHYSIPAFDSMRLPELATPGSIKSSKFIVNAASVLVSKLNPSIPRVWNVDPPQRVPALASTEFLVLRPSLEITTDELWAVCSQPSFTVSLAGKVTGTSNSHQRVKPADLLATEVVDPRTLPTAVRGSISAVARRVYQARIESQSLECLRDALLPKLMSGEIRVRDAERVVEEAT